MLFLGKHWTEQIASAIQVSPESLFLLISLVFLLVCCIILNMWKKCSAAVCGLFHFLLHHTCKVKWQTDCDMRVNFQSTQWHTYRDQGKQQVIKKKVLLFSFSFFWRSHLKINQLKDFINFCFVLWLSCFFLEHSFSSFLYPVSKIWNRTNYPFCV